MRPDTEYLLTNGPRYRGWSFVDSPMLVNARFKNYI